MDDLTDDLIRDAARILDGVAHVTPVLTSRHLDAVANGRVFLKCENFQRTGSFKFRGAYHTLWRLRSTGRVSRVTTVSSGNHAQGLGHAAALLGLSAHVVMPEPYSRQKYQATVGYGATVSVARDRAAAALRAQRIVDEERAIYVHAFNDPVVMAGQGTIMLELLRDVPDLDLVLAPAGGGGLLSGLCVAGHHMRPSLKIVACEPAGALDVEESLRLNRIVPVPDPRTIADGLRTSLGDRTLPILRTHLAGVLRVEEAEIFRAMRFALDRLKVVIEPSSAVALAPVLRAEPLLAGHRIGVVLTGGNVAPELLQQAAGWEEPTRPDATAVPAP